MAEKAKRERDLQREEERKAREMEERRLKEKERRTALARKLEEDRERNERRIQEAARRKEEERKLAETKRRARMKEIQAKYADQIGLRPIMLEGSITVQTSSCISWRRRYFELTAHSMLFFRDSQVIIGYQYIGVKQLMHDVVDMIWDKHWMSWRFLGDA